MEIIHQVVDANYFWQRLYKKRGDVQVYAATATILNNDLYCEPVPGATWYWLCPEPQLVKKYG